MNVLNKIKSKKIPPSKVIVIEEKQKEKQNENEKKEQREDESQSLQLIQQKRQTFKNNPVKNQVLHSDKSLFGQKRQARQKIFQIQRQDLHRNQQQPQKEKEKQIPLRKVNRMTEPRQDGFQFQFQTQHQQNNNKLKFSKDSKYPNNSKDSKYSKDFSSKNFINSNFNNTKSTSNRSNFQSCQTQKESSNSFTNIFKTNRNKKEGIYFQENRITRNNPAKTITSQDSQFQLNSILKASKQKEQVIKLRKQATTKIQNYQQIQNKLLSNSSLKQVLCLMVKKGYSIGDIHVFQGQLISLKLKRIQSYYQFLKKQNVQKLKIKASCNRKIIFHSQNILRIYLKQVSFLSESEIMFSQKYILQIVQKNQMIKRA